MNVSNARERGIRFLRSRVIVAALLLVFLVAIESALLVEATTPATTPGATETSRNATQCSCFAKARAISRAELRSRILQHRAQVAAFGAESAALRQYASELTARTATNATANLKATTQRVAAQLERRLAHIETRRRDEQARVLTSCPEACVGDGVKAARACAWHTGLVRGMERALRFARVATGRWLAMQRLLVAEREAIEVAEAHAQHARVLLGAVERHTHSSKGKARHTKSAAAARAAKWPLARVSDGLIGLLNTTVHRTETAHATARAALLIAEQHANATFASLDAAVRGRVAAWRARLADCPTKARDAAKPSRAGGATVQPKRVPSKRALLKATPTVVHPAAPLSPAGAKPRKPASPHSVKQRRGLARRSAPRAAATEGAMNKGSRAAAKRVKKQSAASSASAVPPASSDASASSTPATPRRDEL